MIFTRISPSLLGISLILFIALLFGSLGLRQELAPDDAEGAHYLLLAKSLAHNQGYNDTFLPGQPAHTRYPMLYPLLLSFFVRLGLGSYLAACLLSLLFFGGALFWLWRILRQDLSGGRAEVAVLFLATIPLGAWSAGHIGSEWPLIFFSLVGFRSFQQAERLLKTHSGAATLPPAIETAIQRQLLLVSLWSLAAYFVNSLGLALVISQLLLLPVFFRKMTRKWLMPSLLLGNFLFLALWFWRNHQASAELKISSAVLLGQGGALARDGSLLGMLVTFVTNLLAMVKLVPEMLFAYHAVLPFPLYHLLVWMLIVWGLVRLWKSRLYPLLLISTLLYGIIVLLRPGIMTPEPSLLPLLPYITICLLFSLIPLITPPSTNPAGSRIFRWRRRGLLTLIGLIIVMNMVTLAQLAGQKQAETASDIQDFGAMNRWIRDNMAITGTIVSHYPTVTAYITGKSAAAYPFGSEVARNMDIFRQIGTELVILDAVWPETQLYLFPTLKEYQKNFQHIHQIGQTHLVRLGPTEEGQ
jgi:hypothetical protein